MSMYALISNNQRATSQGKVNRSWHPVIMAKKRAIFSCHRSSYCWIYISNFWYVI